MQLSIIVLAVSLAVVSSSALKEERQLTRTKRTIGLDWLYPQVNTPTPYYNNYNNYNYNNRYNNQGCWGYYYDNFGGGRYVCWCNNQWSYQTGGCYSNNYNSNYNSNNYNNNYNYNYRR